MNLATGLLRLPRHRGSALLPLCCTAVLPGRRLAWRPPVPLTGLLERFGRIAPATA